MQSKILVTGATGYLASNLLNHSSIFEGALLQDRTIKKARLDSDNYNFHECELRAEQAVIVIHTAHIGDIEKEKKFIRSFPPTTYFIFFSSAAVYGEGLDRTTDTGCFPISDYGNYKLELEDLVEEHFKNYAILRIANPYGKEPGGVKSVYKIFERSIKSGQAITINSEGPKQIIRDLIHIDDLCKQILKVITAKKVGIFNISTGSKTYLEDLAQAIAKKENKRVQIQYAGFKEGDIKESSLVPSIEKQQ